MSVRPLLSIVVPVFNGGKLINACLNSIRIATDRLSEDDRARLEIIVCDNHSTDSTLATAKLASFPCSYSVVQPETHHENRTLNWDYGLRQAAGVWMMMLHADDLMAETGLQAIMKACNSVLSSSVALISGRHRSFTDNKPLSVLHPRFGLSSTISGEAMRIQILALFCPFVPFTVMRRELYYKVGGLNFRYELVQDWDLWIRILAHGSVRYVAKEFGHFRHHDFSPKYAAIFAREHLELTSEIRDLVPALSTKQADAALVAQLARVVKWMPDTSLSEIASGLREWGRISQLQLPNQEEAEVQRMSLNKLVRSRMNRLRVAGTLKVGG